MVTQQELESRLAKAREPVKKKEEVVEEEPEEISARLEDAERPEGEEMKEMAGEDEEAEED